MMLYLVIYYEVHNIYTLFIYPIIGFEINIFIKILLKMLIIASFILLGIKLQFVEKSELDFMLRRVKLGR